MIEVTRRHRGTVVQRLFSNFTVDAICYVHCWTKSTFLLVVVTTFCVVIVQAVYYVPVGDLGYSVFVGEVVTWKDGETPVPVAGLFIRYGLVG